jgi:myo-inositol-1-phosphate synthase
MAPQPPSSGAATPNSEFESVLPVHPTTARRPTYLTVQSENTTYTEEYIHAKYINRGASVVVSDGQFTVTPTAEPYEFQTNRKVGKTGWVIQFSVFTCRFLIVVSWQSHDDRCGRKQW